ncbi:MAG: P1 family peptidase [Pseudomonadota bacterium]
MTSDRKTVAKPGPRNTIADVAGVKVGQAHDAAARTGVTVILPDRPATAAADIRGGGPGTRETDVLHAAGVNQKADAIVLAGGSVYGLDAASAATAWLGARGRGFRLVDGGAWPGSPIVPAAILYDLANGGDKTWGETPPYAALGGAACSAADVDVALGNAGAGYGAVAGALKGGLGSASAVTPDGFSVGAIVAVNAFGSTVMAPNGAFWAWPFECEAEFGGRRPPADWTGAGVDLPDDTKLGVDRPGFATTIGVVAVNAALTPGEVKRIAVMAQDGLARAIRPVHAMVDGDAVFALATDEAIVSGPRAYIVTRLGAIAADCLARAVARGVYAAETLGDAQAYRDAFPDP